MALIDCPGCGNKVSDRAKACPKCGMNLSLKKKQEEQLKEVKHKEKESVIKRRRRER